MHPRGLAWRGTGVLSCERNSKIMYGPGSPVAETGLVFPAEGGCPSINKFLTLGFDSSFFLINKRSLVCHFSIELPTLILNFLHAI